MTLFIETFPVLVAFDNLDMLESLQIAKKGLYGLSGIYGVVHIPTGTSYIGSTLDLGERLMDHIRNNSSAGILPSDGNLHLQSAIVKYGLSHFAFVILENCIPSDQLKREQHFLDILFSLPANLRYNFSPTAGSPLGVVRSEETRAKLSDANKGALNPMYGKVSANAFQSGANNPIFGITPTHAMTINVYSLDNVLVRSFSSQVAVAKWLGVSRGTVQNYTKSGKVWNNLYIFRIST
jgi:hypothetical protein